ncbi:MAG: 2OG-Fe(II) oxygenase [Pseudomonadota bacterium]
MTQQASGPQILTREVFDWMASQSAQGHSTEIIFQALRDAGWNIEAATRAVQMLLESLKTLPVPSLSLPISGGMVDAGDKWVQVIHQSESPNIVVFASLLSDSECDALMDEARPRLSRSLTVDTQTGGEELNPARTSDGMFYTRGETEVVRRVEARIARLLGWPPQNGEGLQVLCYGPGDEYKPHYDYFDPVEPGTAAILQRGGQRVATLIMYLQAPVQGGATIFPSVKVSVAPKRGNAVFFSYPRAHPASLTLHGGEPVVKGEKWIATKWLREREFI